MICALLAVVTLIAYWPVTRCGFINFDDPKYITQNPHIKEGLSWNGIRWAFTTGTYGYWHPLTLLTHLLDFQLYGLNPGRHHLTNLLFHTADAILLFLLLKQMMRAEWRATSGKWGAASAGPQELQPEEAAPGAARHPSPVTRNTDWWGFLVAALFAVHPLHVQSVTWIAERKDVVSTMFFFLTLMAYASYASRRMAKPEGQLRQQGPQTIVKGAENHTARTPHHASPVTSHASRITSRPWFYYVLTLLFFTLGLMSKPMLVTVPFLMLLLDFWPLNPMMNSEDRMKNAGSATTGLPFIIHHSSFIILEKVPFLVLAAASSLATYLATRGPGTRSHEWLSLGERFNNAVVACVGYLGKMFWPVHLSVFYPLHGGLSAAVVIGCGLLLVAITAWSLWCWRRRPWLAVGWFWYLGMLIPVSGIVAVGSHPQAMADRFTYLPLIGIFLMVVWQAGEWLNRLNGLRRLNRQEAKGGEASPVNRHASPVTPTLIVTLLGGLVLAACAAETRQQVSYWQDSESLFLRALEVTRDNDLALNQYCNALMDKGKYDEAATALTAVLKVKPTLVPALLQLGISRSMQGRRDEAEQALSQAVRLAPRNAMARNNLGYLLALEGRDKEAVPEFEAAVRLQPNYESALVALANGYRKLGRTNDLVTCYRQMIHLHPNAIEEVNDLAWILATSPDAKLRNGSEAMQWATHACALTKYQHPLPLATLAAACAEVGRLKEAVTYAEQAKALPGGGQGPLGIRINALLEAFRAGHAYHGGG
jgi:tetratricopeptide (TPR) repeat protein